jgi:hypothetical protein
MFLAHGVGTRSDLPLPVSLAAIGAGLVVVISFAVLAVLWRGPRLSRDAGIPLPRVLTRLADASGTRLLLQGLTLAVGLLVCVIGFLGPPDLMRNIAPWALFVTFWVGLVPASLLFGPVWRVLNPLRLAHAALAEVLRIDPEHGVRRLPDDVGYWPAAASLAGYGWFELVYPRHSQPIPTATFIVLYGVVHTGAAVMFGRRWFDRGDGFEVYSTLLGMLAPMARRHRDRALVLRNPLHGMRAIPAGPGLVGVVVALVGTTAYDGLSRTSWWWRTLPPGLMINNVGLVCSMLLIALIFLLGTRSLTAPRLVTTGPGTSSAGPRPGAFAHTLVPIAAGYAIAHYFSLLVFDGQQTLILASDPFASGLNLLGTAKGSIDYSVLSTSTIAIVQVTAIVLGHLVAAVGAHDQAVRLLPAKTAIRTQFPLVATMVALTMGAIGLIFAP